MFAITESIQGCSRFPHTTACLLQRACPLLWSAQLIQGTAAVHRLLVLTQPSEDSSPVSYDRNPLDT